MYVKKIWQWFSHLGVSKNASAEGPLTVLYNRMALFSVLSMLIFGTFLLYAQIDIIHVVVTFGVGLVYALVLVLNGVNKIYWARLCTSLGTVSWVSLYHICFGGFISQSLAVGAAIIINYVAFRKKTEYLQVIFIVHAGVYFIALIYGVNFDPIIKTVHYPLAGLVSFIVSMGWTTLILVAFHQEKEHLINHLKNKNTALERTTKELERFSYIASHDLKSPLSTIICFGEMIKKDIKKENYREVNEKMDYVISGAQQMNYLIEGILEISQLKKINREKSKDIDLNKILEKVKLHLMEELNQSNAIIRADHLPHFFGNEVELILLFQNIIQNGIKYNKSNPPIISISAHQKKAPDTLCISFQDNGIGIKKVYFKQIFEFFKRLHNTSEYMGTGIGLGLCQKIIENYDGTIKVDSEFGKGTTFTIDLPIPQKEKVHLSGGRMEENII